MEGLKEFLSVSDGSGFGYGSGSGSGDGSGSGYGDGSGSGFGYGFGDGSGYGSGYGDGDGFGYGFGYGDGFGYGYGSGSGSGYGDGFGYGSGYGFGYGSGFGSGVKSINGFSVYQVDGVSTIITRLRANVAKGSILQSDLTLKPCYVVKVGDHFAHGETIALATRDAESKAFEDMEDSDRVDMFLEHFNSSETYSASEFVEWHGRLTGSCEMGRTQFVKDRGIDLNAKYTVSQFVEIVKDAYGSEVIELLEERLKEVQK